MAHLYAKDTSIPYAPTDDRDLYPSEDGKPMAASDYHLRLLIRTLQALEAHFEQNPEVYISGDIMMYYREGDPRKSISPDILVCFGINPKMRRTYKVWEEGKAPDFVMEFSSETTYDKDLDEKMDVYASLKIQDYFLYDAEGLYLPTPLMGFTLVDSVYVAIPPDDDGGIRSSVLGLDFHLQGLELGIYDPIANKWVQTLAEQEAARAENAEARAEQEAARAEQEAIARENAETRAERAEAEVAQLREELARLKARS
ncbi:MAG: Uma2 family endonuclease [Candidatus Poribacteria bacterium]|nr:Uma2 family endonuclease [Candidatus Poribacteria bacterium]